MMKSTRISACLYAAVAALLLAISAGAFAQNDVVSTANMSQRHLPLAGPNRPDSVPADYVVTPFGYFHPSCVHRLTQG